MLRWLLPVVVDAVAFVAGVTLDTRLVAQPEPAAPDGSQSVVDISAKVGPSVVSMRADQEIGRGMIYDANGFILTNAHVVSGTHNITVTLKDGRHFAGIVVGSDTAFDFAVMGLDGAANLPTVGTYYQPMIQTNAGINPVTRVDHCWI
jgi:putative serine protease PepD